MYCASRDSSAWNPAHFDAVSIVNQAIKDIPAAPLDEYDAMSLPDGNLALKKALEFQNDKMDDYAEALTALMQLMIKN
jgi:hypothetical protein